MGRECKGSGPLVSLSGGQGQRESIPQPQCALSLEVFFLKELLHRVSCFSVTYMPGYLRPEAAYSSPQKKQHLQRKELYWENESPNSLGDGRKQNPVWV